MTSKARDIFIAGLKDAYAMEQQAKDTMSSQASRLEDFPKVRARADQHMHETEMQISRLERALQIVGEQPSTLKNLATRAAAGVQGMMHGAVSDEILKDTLSSYAFEHFEIAAYRQLIAMAETLGEPQIAQLARESLEEEKAMAGWLDQNMDDTVRAFTQSHVAALTEATSQQVP